MTKKTLGIFIAMAITLACFSQNTPGDMVAYKIAVKMKNGLNLNEGQKNKIYSINQDLNNSKTAVRQQYTGNPGLQRELQKVENTRDALYKPVLTATQFEQYVKQKAELVNNDD